MKTKLRNNGFSLIELLIVIAIVAILAAVAIPSYSEHVARGIRAEARTQLQMAALYMQRFQAANDSYMADRDGISVAKLIPAQFTQSPADGKAVYKLEFGEGRSTVSATDFTLVMSPVAGQRMANDKCGGFTLDSYGRKAVTKSEAMRDGCWR